MLALVVGLLVLAYAIRDEGPGAAARPAERTPPGPVAPPAIVPVEAGPIRNVFEYVERAPAPARVVVAAPPRVTAPAETTPRKPEPAVRLVGLVNRGGRLHAALAVGGEVVVISPGESAGGYVVEAIDEDDGVRLRGPDGAALKLPPPD